MCITQVVCGQIDFNVWYKESKFLMPSCSGSLDFVAGNEGFLIDRFIPVRNGFLFYSMMRGTVYFYESESGYIKDSISIFQKGFHTKAFMSFPIFKKRGVRYVKYEVLRPVNNFYLINDTTIFLDYYFLKDSLYLGICNIRNNSLNIDYNKDYSFLSSITGIEALNNIISIRPDRNCCLLRNEIFSEDTEHRIFNYNLISLDTSIGSNPGINFLDTISRKSIDIIPKLIVQNEDLIMYPISNSLLLYKNYFNSNMDVQILRNQLNNHPSGNYEYDIVSGEEYIKNVISNQEVELYRLLKKGDQFSVDSIFTFKLIADQKIKNVIVSDGYVVFLLWNPFFSNYYLYRMKMNDSESLSISFSKIFLKADSIGNISNSISQESDFIIDALGKCEKLNTFSQKRIEKELSQIIDNDLTTDSPESLFKVICKVLAIDPTKLLYLFASDVENVSKITPEQFNTSFNSELILRLQDVSLKLVLNSSQLDEIDNSCKHFSVLSDSCRFHFVKKRSMWHILLKVDVLR